MADSYDLSHLSPDAFEHLVNAIALRVLGSGHTGFGPGPDAGRDGYFEGEAPYPSDTDRWSGRWYIQSKFHTPHLSKNPQRWLVERISEEITAFKNPKFKRIWPDIWIVATNIDPSGKAVTGTFDVIRNNVRKARPKLASKFHIWGGRKIIDLLQQYPEVANYYRHFLTPGHILTELYDQLKDERAEVKTIVRHLIVNQFDEQQYTKLEQAGSETDRRPGIHALFIDLPFRAPDYDHTGMITRTMAAAASGSQRIDPTHPNTAQWKIWRQHPSRARVWFIKGGPGHGKSTVGQYFAQIQRAGLILSEDGPSVLPVTRELAKEVKAAAEEKGLWPTVPRIPLYVELKEFAQWFGGRSKDQPRGILSYLCARITAGVEQTVLPGTLKRALSIRTWFAMFDGLDEVPDDAKDDIALQVAHFINEIALDAKSDLVAVCTSRPQGYSGQFSDLDGPTIELTPLSPQEALECAEPVLRFGRSPAESSKAIQTITSAIRSEAVRSLMTTPLQSHIMAVVVRDGGKPPDRRWQLFDNFYHVIKRRETNRDLPDEAIARLLREDHKLLKTVHNRLGFVLHARSEVITGALTSLNRTEFRSLASDAVVLMMDEQVETTVDTLMRATTNRLVLVNTPDDGQHVRFDIRQLQEFFAAEFLYESIDATKLRKRLELLAGDAHWREVMHFALSALIENGRSTDIDVAVEVLASVNDSPTGVINRMLNRRLAAGALMAARLLEEGVLEQDRRIRQQFRKCLEPALALTNMQSLASLQNVSQSNSLNWLLSFLLEHIKEADPTESVGAGILLTLLLPDSDRRTSDLTDFFLSAPQKYTLTILRHHPSSQSSRRKNLPFNWVRSIALQILLREAWVELSTNDIKSLSRLLAGPPERQLDIAVRIGLPREHVGLLAALLWESIPSQDRKPTFDEYGIVSADYYKNDWSTPTVDFGILKDHLPSEASSASGILRLVYLIFRFAKFRKPADLRALAEFVAAHPVAFAALPQRLRAYAPFDIRRPVLDQARDLAGMSHELMENFILALRNAAPPLKRLQRWATLGSDCDLGQWNKLISDFPDLSWRLWCDNFWTGRMRLRPRVFDDPQALSLLVSRLIEVPSLLTKQPLVVGDLLKKAPQHEGELRAAFVKQAQSERTVDLHAIGDSSFELSLPEESAVLPLILAAFVGDDIFRFSEVSPADAMNRLRTLCIGFVPHLSSLVALYQDQANPPDIRAAALLLSFIHPDGADRIRSEGTNLVEMYHPTVGPWFFQAAVLNLAHLPDPNEETIDAVVGGLLYVTRGDYEGREVLENYLVDLRERSRAPITKSGLQGEWLSGRK